MRSDAVVFCCSRLDGRESAVFVLAHTYISLIPVYKVGVEIIRMTT